MNTNETSIVGACVGASLAHGEARFYSANGLKARCGKRLTGFPRGELLSLGTNGASNYAVNPVKVLAWIHAKTSSATPKGGA